MQDHVAQPVRKGRASYPRGWVEPSWQQGHTGSLLGPVTKDLCSGPAATGGGWHMAERAYERYAWTLLVVVSALFIPIAIGDVILGAGGDPVTTESVAGIPWGELQASDPAVANLVDLHARVVGAGLLAFLLLSLAVALTAYRRGERWAWYGLWTWPLVLGLIIVL